MLPCYFQAWGAVCPTASCSPDHQTVCTVLHEEGLHSSRFLVSQSYGIQQRVPPNIISLVSPTEQRDAQLSGLQKAVEGQ